MSYPSGTPFSCTSCSTSLQFMAHGSNCIICPGCRFLNYRIRPKSTTCLRKLEAVQEDMSVIRIGTSGTSEGINFEVIGRLQYFFQERYRNHWFLIYSDGRTGWLGDWDGNYSLFTQAEAVRSKFENPAPGKMVQINNIEYITEQIDVSRCVFGEGELGAFYLDENKFITLELYTTDYRLALANIFTQKTIEVFTGQYLELGDLNLQNLRQDHDWI
ncbi:MAG: hypothetical protein ACO1OF_17425 [Adhaeribacter sp.]